MAKRKHKGTMRRSDIPYAKRLQMDQIATISAVREHSAQITLFCLSVALNRLYGKGYKSLVRYSLVFKQHIDEFYDNYEVSLDRCRRRLASHGITIKDGFPVVSAPGMNPRDKQQYDNAIHASYVAHIVGLIAVNETFKKGKEPMERISVLAAELMEQYNKEGAGFLFDEMQRIGFPIINGKVTACLDDDNNPISYKKYLEGQG